MLNHTHAGKLKTCAVSLGTALALSLSLSVRAQDDAVEVEIDRDATQLSELLAGAPHPKPEVGGLLDSAMVITSVSGYETVARCHANDHNGKIAGRVRVRIPPNGVRFFLASDIIAERGFVGSVICTAAGFVLGTEVMFGVIDTAIDVEQDYRSGTTSILFPVTAMR